MPHPTGRHHKHHLPPCPAAEHHGAAVRPHGGQQAQGVDEEVGGGRAQGIGAHGHTGTAGEQRAVGLLGEVVLYAVECDGGVAEQGVELVPVGVDGDGGRHTQPHGGHAPVALLQQQAQHVLTPAGGRGGRDVPALSAREQQQASYKN